MDLDFVGDIVLSLLGDFGLFDGIALIVGGFVGLFDGIVLIVGSFVGTDILGFVGYMCFAVVVCMVLYLHFV